MSVQDLSDRTRPQAIERLVRELNGRTLPAFWDTRGETGSWAQSLPVLADLLVEAQLHGLWVALEYNPYQAGRSRADAIVMGVGRDGRPTYLVVELKQWEHAGWDSVLARVTGTGARYERVHELRHPYEQAHSYGQCIRNFSSGMHDSAEVRIEAAALLHNATQASIADLGTAGPEHAERTFSGDREGRQRFAALLAKLFDPDRGGRAASDRLSEATYEQGIALLDAAADIFSDREKYPLTDQQHAVFGDIQNAVAAAMSVTADRSQAVIVVKGGPGTGKTWIAMHLISANARARRQISYATNSSSLREALRRSAKSNRQFSAKEAHRLITSARTYWQEERWREPLDLLIVDEAHRVEEYTVRTAQNNPRHVQQHLVANDITQLFELKKSAKVLVLFIDEDQASTYKDFATIDTARQIAERTGASFQVMELTEQHRSGGSEAYEAWVDDLVVGRPSVWHDEDAFTMQVADSPEELEKLVFDDSTSARLLAGFCWKWQLWPEGVSSIDDVPYDIDIDGWQKRWNLRHRVAGFPENTAWANDPRGAAQVGSIFTAQGFEFDRCGVIIGPDMVWDDATQDMAVNAEASRYDKLVQLCRQSPDEADRIRNQYRVLLTRAMKAVVVYSTDPATQALLKRIVNPGPATT